MLEIRFDAVRFDPQFGKESYENLLANCLEWIKTNLKVDLFLCDGSNTIAVINGKKDESISNILADIYLQRLEYDIQNFS